MDNRRGGGLNSQENFCVKEPENGLDKGKSPNLKPAKNTEKFSNFTLKISHKNAENNCINDCENTHINYGMSDYKNIEKHGANNFKSNSKKIKCESAKNYEDINLNENTHNTILYQQHQIKSALNVNHKSVPNTKLYQVQNKLDNTTNTFDKNYYQEHLTNTAKNNTTSQNTLTLSFPQKIIAIVVSLALIISLLGSGVLILVNLGNNDTKALKDEANVSIGEMLKDGNVINPITYQILLDKLGNNTTSTRNKSAINGGLPVVFQTRTAYGNPMYWQVVYQSGDIITVWLTAGFHDENVPSLKNSIFGSSNVYETSSLRDYVNSVYTDQQELYPVFNSIIISPNSSLISSAYKAEQDKEYTYSGYTSSTSTLSSFSDKFWIPSLYEVFSLWGVNTDDILSTCASSWLRSGDAVDKWSALLLGTYKNVQIFSSEINETISKMRPACHISLSKMLETFGSNVNFDRQGATNGSLSIIAANGSAMPTITPPTRTGYTFGGYWTEQNGGGTQYYTSTGASARNWDKTGDATLYAYWIPNTYTITYNGNGATSGSMPNSTHTYDVAQNLTSNAYTRLGYRFTGWGLTSNATAPVYIDGQNISNLTATNGATITLYALWGIEYYTVTFVSNNTDYGTILNAGKTGSFVYGDTYTSYAISKIGCALLYWLDSANPNTPIYENPLTITVTGDKTYTAYFTNSLVDGVSVVATSGGEARIVGFETGDTEITLIAVAYAGYQFDGWFIQGEGTLLSTDLSCILPMNTVDSKIVVARFSKIINNTNNSTNTPDNGGFV